MNDNERDTHFKGFAKLLYQEICEVNEGRGTLISENLYEQGKQEPLLIMARAAYDLIVHSIHEMGLDTPATFHDDLYTPEDIPDMTAWPDTPSHNP